MKTNIISLAVCAVLVSLSLSCLTPRERLNYRDCLREAESGNKYFAIMKLRAYIKEFPESSHNQRARFALSEFYTEINNYQDALSGLKSYIEDYPNDKSTVFAKALLYRLISERGTDPGLLESVKQNFFSKSVFLVFSSSKTKSFRSAAGNKYKVIDYIDRIEFYRNNELFLEVQP